MRRGAPFRSLRSIRSAVIHVKTALSLNACER